MTAAFIQDEIDAEKEGIDVEEFDSHVLKLRKPMRLFPRRGWVERLLRGWSAKRIRALRVKIRDIKTRWSVSESGWNSVFDTQESLLRVAEKNIDRLSRELDIEKATVDKLTREIKRLETVNYQQDARIKELDVDLAISRRENDLLASVVERNLKRVEAETRVHCQLIEENNLRTPPAVAVTREVGGQF